MLMVFYFLHQSLTIKKLTINLINTYTTSSKTSNMSYRHSQYSDPYPFSSGQPTFPDIPDFFLDVHSDEEVILASTRPKKRAGRKKFKETRHPVYRGVRQRNGNRWVCELRAPNNKARIWLGTYPTAEMAARAHDVAALALRGRMACLNFADSAWRLPVPVSTDTRDIQQAAAEAAEAFRPPVSGSEITVESTTKLAHQYDEVSNVGKEQIRSGNDKEVGEKNDDYVDEEAVFDMPRLLANMAEGLLLPPPCTTSWDDKETDDCDLSLWDYSV